MKGDRIYIIDYSRIISALAVIIVHVTATGAMKNEQGYFLNQLCRFSVPLFFIISGMSLFNSYFNSKKLDTKVFYKKRFGKIIVPYLIWTIIYIIYGAVRNSTKITPWIVFTKIIFGVEHLYFLVIIVQIYILFPLLIHIYHKLGKSLLFLSLIVSMYFNIAILLSAINVFILPSESIKYLYLLFPSWIFYFVLGIYSMENYSIIKDIVIRNKVLIWSFTYICFMIMLAGGKLTGLFNSSMRPIILIYCILVFFTIISIFEGKKASETVIWLSKQSFGIYLCHMILLSFLKGYFWLIKFNINNQIFILLLCTVLCSIFFVYMASYVKISKYLGIVPKEK